MKTINLQLYADPMKRLLYCAVALVITVVLGACGSGGAKTAALAGQDGAEVCLWLVWAKSPALATQVQEQLRSGRSLRGIAQDIQRLHPDQASFNADCMPASRIDPSVLNAVRGLKVGQYSDPFPLKDGTAIAMRTTETYRQNGRALFKKGQYAQAEKELLEDLRLHPHSAMSWHLIAMSRAARNDQGGALGALDQALLLTPREPTVFNEKLAAPAAFDMPEDVLPLYLSALEVDPDSPRHMGNLAWLLMQKNRDSEQVNRLLGSALRAEPREAAHWNSLGRLFQARGDHAGAVVSFHRAALLDPQSSLLHKRLLLNLLALDPATVERLSGAAAPGAPRTSSGRSLPPAPPSPPLAKAPTPPAPLLTPAPPAPPAPQVPQVPALGEPPASAKAQTPPAAATPRPVEGEPPAPAPAPEGQPPLPPPPPEAQPQAPPQATAPPSAGSGQAPGADTPPASPTAEQPPAAGADDAKVSAAPSAPPAPGRPDEAARVDGGTSVSLPVPQDADPEPDSERPPQAAPKEQTPPGASAPAVFLQVASYRQRSSADQELGAWVRRGQRAKAERWSKNDQVWYRVLLGPYASYEEAVETGRRLQQRKLVKEFNVVVY